MYDLLCFSHLRWDFVFQRPQHLLSRAARDRRVYFWEEPVPSNGAPKLRITRTSCGVTTLIPELPSNVDPSEAQRKLLTEWLRSEGPRRYVSWYYTPMALSFTQDLKALATVYDCMDQLSAFKGAPPELPARERQLMRQSDVVFCGGRSLYESKRAQHQNIHVFPSSVDVAHFGRARNLKHDPSDQADIPRPRLGFFGVIDERMDVGLLEAVARARPDFQLVLVGPVVKIDPAHLPTLPNIHYLGAKTYAELPHYIAGWDVALLPFARNESTEFISPTKTPEYLAAGKPVVSTSIRDVVTPYGNDGLAHIADDPAEFVRACEQALAEPPLSRITRADAFLSRLSWDRTWLDMKHLVDGAVLARSGTVTRSAFDADQLLLAAGAR